MGEEEDRPGRGGNRKQKGTDMLFNEVANSSRRSDAGEMVASRRQGRRNISKRAQKGDGK